MSVQLPHKKIGVAVIRNDRRQILIDRRRNTGDMAGLWEFPGGKIEPDETVEECIQREILEELAIEIEVIEPLIEIEHTYPNFRVTLFVYFCHHISGEPQPIECDEVRWVNVSELNRYTFPEANLQIIQELQNRFLV
ncbi:MAG: 8-oxo-dGTP diphosphatase MutT [Xenococcaceae cyanobacterium]